MMKRRGLCTTRTIVGALVLTMGAITTSTIAQEIGLAAGSNSINKINQGQNNTGHDCPNTVVDADGAVHLTQNDNIFQDDENSVACQGAGTTPNGWARCFDLVAEGINGDLNIDVVYFGIQQATIEDILINVNLYISNVGCDLDPGSPPDAQATLVATGSRLVGPADELGSLKPVFFTDVLIPAGSILIIEIESPGDGNIDPPWFFRPRSNFRGQCGSTYLRAVACGIPGWIALDAIGFPDNHVVIKCFGQEKIPDVPEGDTCDDCIPVGEGVFFGNTDDNTATADLCGFAGDTITEWYCYTASCTGTATVNTCGEGTDFDTTLAMLESCGSDPSNCNDDSCGLQSQIQFPVVSGVTYFIRIAGFGGQTGNYELSISCQEPQPSGCSNCTEIGDGITFGSTLGAPSEDDIQSCTFGGPSATETVWHCYTATCDGVVTMDTCGPGTDYDTVLGAWSACPEDGGVQLACNDDACPGFKSEISFNATAGVTYFIRVSGFANTEGNYELNVVCGDGGPGDPACTPDAGDCCSANGTPGCNDNVCCNIICDADPFCCESEWDSICAASAAADCGKLCGGNGEPCECPDGSLEEGEVCGSDTNGGCNSSPVVFTDASCGDTFCGSAWADGGTRDTDWYLVTVDDPDGDGLATITGTLFSEFNGVVFIVSGIANCAPAVEGQTGASNNCKSNGAASATVAAPGTYVVFVANAGFDGNPCGSGNSYTLEISCEGGGAAPPCPWDLDGDSNIGTSDLLILFSQWGLDGTADFDGSGVVDTADLLILFANWGPCP